MNGRDYLLIVDYFTSYPEVTLLTETTSSAIIAHTKSIFARHGIPDTVITDNGPQFTSREYRDFAKQWEFKHTTSSPLHPRANGKVERTVQTIKGLLKKATRSGEDPYLTLLNFRACSAPDGTPSPAMLLMNRKIKTRLPELNEQELSTRSLKQKQYYDRRTKALPEISSGSNVRLHDGKSWSIRGQVIERAETPRSYIIQTETGGQLRRNRQDVLVPQQPEPQGPEEPASEEFSNPEASNDLEVQPAQTKVQSGPSNSYAYVTRYGRTIKPPTRFQ